MAATEPGAFYGAVVQPVAAQAQPGLWLPPAIHIQRRCGVGIQPAVGGGLHAGRIGAAQLGKRLQQHRALAESYFLQGQLGAAVEQLQFAQQATDGNFYEQSVVDDRLRELRKLQEEEAKRKRGG